VAYGLDVVAIRIEYKRAVVSRVVASRARSPVVSSVCIELGLVKPMDLDLLCGLKREVDM